MQCVNNNIIKNTFKFIYYQNDRVRVYKLTGKYSVVVLHIVQYSTTPMSTILNEQSQLTEIVFWNKMYLALEQGCFGSKIFGSGQVRVGLSFFFARVQVEVRLTWI